MGRLGRLSGQRGTFKTRGLTRLPRPCKKHPIPRRPVLELGDLTGGRACSWDRKSWRTAPGLPEALFFFFSFALLCSGSKLTHRRPHWDAFSHPESLLTLQRLTKTGTHFHGHFLQRWKLLGFTHPLPHSPPPIIGKQACFNFLILWRNHERPRCSPDNESIAQKNSTIRLAG